MILKIRNDNVVSWSYFECDTFHFHYKKLNEIEEDCFRFLDCEPIEIKNAKKIVKVIRLEPQTKRRPVITDRIVYVLNNEGKTIDKI